MFVDSAVHPAAPGSSFKVLVRIICLSAKHVKYSLKQVVNFAHHEVHHVACQRHLYFVKHIAEHMST